MIVAMAVRPAEMIERKRDGGELSDEEISDLVLGFTRGDVPDYQMAAWCMAVYFKGPRPRDACADRRDDPLGRDDRPRRRRSAGAWSTSTRPAESGDKTSLAVGPIVAACGVPFGKMSGRGLGHTGGTLDKLESIPGFRVELTIDAFVSQVREVGLAIIGQTGDLVPADKKLYALRDVTATVEIVPLIASSIMSKKIATGADAIVLDVKVGDGAFMKTLDDARVLAEQMVDLGRRRGAGDRVSAHRHGSASRRGGRKRARGARGRRNDRRRRAAGFHRARARRLRAAARALGSGIDVGRGSMRAEAAMVDGSATATYERWIRAQGGNPDLAALPLAPIVREVLAPHAGVVSRLGALAVGIASLELGAGRGTKEDDDRPRRGRRLRAKRGQTPSTPERRSPTCMRATRALRPPRRCRLGAYEIGDEPPPRARDPARRRRVERCPSSPRSRRFERSSLRASRGGHSRESRSSTHG